jgi:hypothetical protein
MIRLKSISGAGRKKLFAGANYFLAQGYNKAFMLPGNATSSFCSEFAVKAFQRAGFEILEGHNPSQVSPSHFDREADRLEEWEDVTQEYRQWLDRFKVDPNMASLEYEILKSQIEKVRRRVQQGEVMFQATEKLFQSESMKAKLAAIREELEKRRNFRFWDEEGEKVKRQ